jgi:hypothetical protein
MSMREQIPKKPVAAPPPFTLAPFATVQGQCACGSTGSLVGECAQCKKKKTTAQSRASAQAGPKTASVDAQDALSRLRPELHASPPASAESGVGHNFGQIRVFPGGQAEDTASKEKNKNEDVVVVGQGAAGAATPDGNPLGATNAAKKVCMAPRSLIWYGGPDQNTATAARGKSRVVAHLGTPPAGAADCDCNCGLFRQFLRGFWRIGGPASPKRHDIGSCGTQIVMNENTWTEEHEACNPGGAPIGANCARTYLDGPGFSAGLADGVSAELNLDLRYQMWDQCQGHEVETGDRRLRISGDHHPRAITFS